MNKLLVGLLLSVGCISANAANWVYQGESTQGTLSYVDTSSLIWSDHTYTTRSAWIKTYNKNGTSVLNRFFVHCPTKMQAVTELHFYDNSGMFITSQKTNDSWDYNIPNSMGDTWVYTVCNTKATTR